ncbi:MAG: hypothetical protein NC548_41130, partial [Lachnospiraceae bacterium]|nr:hypothetical protein [Lachnospiraceae bacterium]
FYVMSVEDIDSIEQKEFDIAFINSATQYMGPADEFKSCIVKMIDKVRKGGKIFLGDNKSAVLQEKFYRLIALWNGVCDDAEEKIDIKRKTDFEFYIGKEFFDSLSDIPRVKHITLLVKKGKAVTEMNMFRYEAVIYLDEYDEKEYFDIDCSDTDISAIEEKLRENSNKECIRLANIRNKLLNDVFSEKLGEEKLVSLYVSDVCELAEKYGYNVTAVPSENESPEYFNIEAYRTV